jgi:hypothetical protein
MRGPPGSCGSAPGVARVARVARVVRVVRVSPPGLRDSPPVVSVVDPRPPPGGSTVAPCHGWVGSSTTHGVAARVGAIRRVRDGRFVASCHGTTAARPRDPPGERTVSPLGTPFARRATRPAIGAPEPRRRAVLSCSRSTLASPRCGIKQHVPPKRIDGPLGGATPQPAHAAPAQRCLWLSGECGPARRAPGGPPQRRVSSRRSRPGSRADAASRRASGGAGRTGSPRAASGARPR